MPQNKPAKIFTVVGARPQFIKAAAVSRALRASAHLHEVMVHTGQHFDPDMSDLFFEELDIAAPAHRLDIHGGGHGDMTGRMLLAVEPLVEQERPDYVLVYGDTEFNARRQRWSPRSSMFLSPISRGRPAARTTGACRKK